MHSKQYRPYAPGQAYLLPPCPMDWLPEDHLVYFLLELVPRLDLSAIHRKIQAKDPRGNRPYDPQMMVALLLYAWCVGKRSSREIARLLWVDVAFRVVSGNAQPHFTVLAEFRRTFSTELAALFEQVLAVAQELGLVALSHVAVDGTKVQAAASKHKAMSYERMKQTRDRLQEEVAKILAEAEQADQQEDAQHGADRDGTEMPAELTRRQSRIAAIEGAMAALEAEAKQARAQALREQAERARQVAADEQAEAAERRRAQKRAEAREEQARDLDPPDDDTPPPSATFTTPQGLPKNRPPVETDGTPKPKAQRNFTDPQSRIQERGGSFLQGYNCQAAVDDKEQIIVACAVTNQAPDAGNFVPMLDLTIQNCGQAPKSATGDTGYWNATVEEEARERGVEAYIATKRRKHGEAEPPTMEEPPPDDADARARMEARLNTALGRETYRRRKFTVEPVFGQMKGARGLVRFLRRGLAAVSVDWVLECTCHNILKLFRAQLRRKASPPAALPAPV